jgi:hypothetical protein
MSQTYNHCYWISPESVTIAHWGCSFTFFPVEVFENSFLSELLSYGKRVLLRFFFHEKTSPSHLSTWKSGLIAILIVCYECHDVSLLGPVRKVGPGGLFAILHCSPPTPRIAESRFYCWYI